MISALLTQLARARRSYRPRVRIVINCLSPTGIEAIAMEQR